MYFVWVVGRGMGDLENAEREMFGLRQFEFRDVGRYYG